jgi:hypothetical protein
MRSICEMQMLTCGCALGFNAAVKCFAGLYRKPTIWKTGVSIDSHRPLFIEMEAGLAVGLTAWTRNDSLEVQLREKQNP